MTALSVVLFVSVILAKSLFVIGDSVTDFVHILDQTLQGYGNMTKIASLITYARMDTVEELMSGNHTLIATPDEYFFFDSLRADNDTFLRYQILAGTLQEIPPSQFGAIQNPVYRTLLKGGPSANLPGNQAQVIPFIAPVSQSGTWSLRTTYMDADRNLSTSTTIQVAGYPPIHVDIQLFFANALPPPPSITNLTAIWHDESNIALSSYYLWGQWLQNLSSNALQVLDGLQGVTAFGNDDAVFTAEVNQTINKYSDAASKSAIFGNLYVPGIALYSPMIDETTALVTASGQPLNFIKNTTGLYVVSGGVTARIVRADTIVAGGVVHLIDRPLLNTNVDLLAASRAYSDVSSMMATQTSIATTPLGLTSPAASSISTTTPKNGSSLTFTPTTPENGSSSKSTTTPENGSSLGAIIGGAAGGVVLLALLVLASCVLVRRRRQHSKGVWDSGDKGGSEKEDWESPRLPFDANVAEAYEVSHDAPRPDTRNRGMGAAQTHEVVNLLPFNDGDADDRGLPPQPAAHRVSIQPPSRRDSNDQRGRGSGRRGGGGEGAAHQVGDGGGTLQPEASPRSHSPAHDVMSIANATAEILLRRMMGHQSSGSGSGLGLGSSSIEAAGSRSALSADYRASPAAAGGDKTRTSTIENPDPAESEGDDEARSEAPSSSMTAPPAYQQ